MNRRRVLPLVCLLLVSLPLATLPAQAPQPGAAGVRVAIVLGNAPAPRDFAAVVDSTHDVVANAQPSDLIVVYEPYASTDPMPWPTPARRRSC